MSPSYSYCQPRGEKSLLTARKCLVFNLLPKSSPGLVLSAVQCHVLHLEYSPDWSTLIGRAPTLLRSHWSRPSPVMLAPAVLCHKEPARASKAGSLWHKDSWLPCTERSYYRRPYAIKNQRGASRDARAGSLWHKTAGEATPRSSPRHRGGPVWSKYDIL